MVEGQERGLDPLFFPKLEPPITMVEKEKKQKRRTREKNYISDGSGSIISSSDDEDNGPTHFPDALFMKSEKGESKKKHKRSSTVKEKDDKKDDKKKKSKRSSSEVKSDRNDILITKSEKAKKKEKRTSKAHRDDQKKKKKEKRSSRKHADEKAPKKEKNRRKEDKKRKDKKHSKKRHKAKEEFGGRAMPRQQTRASISVDETAGSGDGSFLDTLENLIGTDIGGRILGKYSKDSRSLEGNGSSHSRREEKRKKQIPNKHKYSGSGDNQGLSQSLHNVSGHHRSGRQRKERYGDVLRKEVHPDSSRRGMFETLHDNMPSGLTLPSNLGFPRLGKKEITRDKASLHESIPSGLDCRGSNRSRRSQRSMHDSMPSGLDMGRDRSIRSKRSVGLDGSRRGARRGLISKQPSVHDSMPADLNYGRDGRSSRHRRGSGSIRKKSKKRTALDFNVSVSDRMNLSDTNRHRTDRRPKAGDKKSRDLHASMPDRMNLSDNNNDPDRAPSRSSAGKIKRRNSREPNNGTNEQTEDTRGTSNSRRNQKRGTRSESLGASSLTKDEGCLLKFMSVSQIKDLYFTEIGFFDWKKWRKQKHEKKTRGKKIKLLPVDTDQKPDKRSRGSPKTDMGVKKSEVNRQGSRTQQPTRSYVGSSDIPKQKNERNNETIHIQEDIDNEYDFPTSTASVDDEKHVLGVIYNTVPYVRDDGHSSIRIKESEGIEDPIKRDPNASGANAETTEIPKELEDNPADLKILQVADAELPQIGNESAYDHPSSPNGPPVSESRSVGVDKSVEDADEDPPNQFVRVDSTARELAKLTEFMTTIDVLSNQEAVEKLDAYANQEAMEKSAREAEEKDSSCCAIL